MTDSSAKFGDRFKRKIDGLTTSLCSNPTDECASMLEDKMATSQVKMKLKQSNFGQNAGQRKSEFVEIRARDIMAAPVSSVSPEMTVHDLAVLLDDNKISVAPVIDDDQLVGIVSVSDLLQREELGTSPSISGDQRPGSNIDYDKYHGKYVRDVMSPNVQTIDQNTGLVVICELMLEANIRHLPVIDDKELVGIVSRSDIVHALASRPEDAGPPRSYDDDIIRYRVMDALIGIPGTRPWFTKVDVLDGVVTLNGSVSDETVLVSSIAAIEDLDHVKRIEDHRTILQPY